MSASTPTPSTTPQTRHYSLQVIRFESTSTSAKATNLYAKVRLGDDKDGQQTSRIKGTSPSWNTRLAFSSSDTSARFNIRVKYVPTSFSRFLKKSSSCIGSIDISIADLLQKSSRSEVKLDLHPPDGRPGPSSGIGAIYLRLERTDEIAGVHADADNAAQTRIETLPIAEPDPLSQNNSSGINQPSSSVADVRANINDAIDAIRRRGIASSAMGEKFAAIGGLSDQLGDQSELYKSIWALCKKIGIFADIVDKLAVAHPYLNAAWQITSSLFRVVEKKFDNDQSIVELVCTASETFDFVCEAEELPNKVESLQRFITGLLKQTTELCIFVQHYASQRLAGQLLTLNDSSEKINEFKDCFLKIKSEFAAPLALQAVFLSSRISEKVDNIYSEMKTAFVSARMSERVDTIYLAQQLKPDDKAATGRPECLPGTRSEYLNRIMDWAFSDSAENILWLHGVAGSGKSTISMTIAEQCLSMLRRGAYMYFERGKSDPNSVIRSIAFWLAEFDHSIAKHISEAVKSNNGIAKASLTSQFEVLLLKPLRAAAENMAGPVIVILDALDECGPKDTRQELLKLLSERIPELPRNFRFIITSRQEPDISRAFSDQTHILPIKLDHDSKASRDDVSKYFTHEMNEFFEIPEIKQQVPPDWPLAKNIAFLAEKALGLFIWASTSMKHVKKDEMTAFVTLDELIKDVQTHGASDFGLRDLYSAVLRSTQISWSNKDIGPRFQRVMYLILEVRIALSTFDIDAILGLSPQNSSSIIISRLQSVLDYTPGSQSRIRPLHTSFADFLKSPEQSQEPWYIDVDSSREYITKQCLDSFDIMNGLHFNMCNVETSFKSNNDIPELQSRIEEIPVTLKGACLSWAQRLRILSFSPNLIDKLSYFLHNHLLSWLEVLSLMGRMDVVTSALLDALRWVAGYNTPIEPFLRDASKLVPAFDIPISKSVPHIYLSMLPLAWPGSEVAAHYSRAIAPPSDVKVVGNRSQRAPPTVFKGHTDFVTFIAYSADGKRIVSGSWDKFVIVWDAESGEIIAGPFKRHTDYVNSVGFSRDGKFIVSGSEDKSVIIWNAESGEVFRGPLEGHDGPVNCVSFSPDGKHVVSGSNDSTIKVWEVESGKAIPATFEGHSSGVYAVAYSPDGEYIVSGSVDGTLRVWGAQNGKLVKGPLDGHTGVVRSAMFSPDGKRIVSGSYDNTIRIWDFESGELVVYPFKGHTNYVIFVAFSADGKLIFSGSYDDTMKVWDAKSGEIISSMVGEDVWSVAFAPNGKCVASGSFNGTIRVFDVQADKNAPGSFEGHTGGVTSIACSPDGKHIVSSSRDKTLVVWDVESGKVVAGPFKGHSDWIRSVAYSADGKHIVSGSFDKTLIVWDAGTGEVISGPLKEHTSNVLSVGFSPDGRQVVSGSGDNTIIVWEVESGSIVLGPLEGHSGWVRAVEFSPDGKRIVSGSDDKTIRVWSAENGEAVLATFEGHTAGVLSVAYSPDGRYIVSGSLDKTVIVTDAERGVKIAGPFYGHTDGVNSVQFSPNGKHIVSGSRDKTIILWDVGSGKAILGPLKGHANGVSSVRFSPDGSSIASGSYDRTIRVWDVENAVAPMASTEGSIHQNWTLSEDGWVLGQEGELLLWIPSDMHSSLWHARNTAVMNRFVTKLHFTERGIGENWHECFDSRKLTVE